MIAQTDFSENAFLRLTTAQSLPGYLELELASRTRPTYVQTAAIRCGSKS